MLSWNSGKIPKAELQHLGAHTRHPSTWLSKTQVSFRSWGEAGGYLSGRQKVACSTSGVEGEVSHCKQSTHGSDEQEAHAGNVLFSAAASSGFGAPPLAAVPVPAGSTTIRESDEHNHAGIFDHICDDGESDATSKFFCDGSKIRAMSVQVLKKYEMQLGGEPEEKKLEIELDRDLHGAKRQPYSEPNLAGGARAQGTRVLIVDDVAMNRKMLRRILESRFDAVDEAEDGQQAVEIVARSLGGEGGRGRSYDVITMDYQMPVMDGVTASRLIRGMGFSGKIVAVTGNALEEDVLTFKASGADAVLMKPLDLRLFDSIVRLDDVSHAK